ncbi:TolC family protein [Hyphomicrobium sp. DMF-1]|uniref:TolC family protein n=1 Tax=Hyphomicrobium sp. DMF-1 TaxID=3019544 RepID=UPI0022EBD983|nr:TolC family protein [Hyphomicrobium sp. DMF-1]WBT37964.1 TolC family protein [Hyphomicrobium sp. DMF-1]
MLALGLSGCETRPLGSIETEAIAKTAETDRDLPRREWPVVIETPPASHGPHAQVETLTLREAVGRVINHSPAIKAAFTEIQARRGEELQASVKPNPDVKLDVEDFLGADTRSGFEASQETLSIVQLFEFGDKRVKRLRAASMDTSIAGWEMETIRVREMLQAVQAYVEVLAAQERLDVLRKSVSLGEKVKAAVDKRVKIGSTSAIELDRANVTLTRARSAVVGEETRLSGNRLRLAALWGARYADFTRVSGKLGNGTDVPSTERVLAYTDGNPLIARWSDEIGRRAAQLDLEAAKSVRDFTVGGGVRRYEDTDEAAFVVSVSTPLKIFDTNAGAITAAEQRVVKAEHDREAARVSVTGSVAEAMTNLRVAAAQVRSLQREVLPAAESSYEKTQAGYEQARFDLLNVLDAQRTLFEVRLELVNAKADFEKAKAQVEALVGRPLSEI